MRAAENAANLELAQRDDATLARLLTIWESSVRATHTFLTEDDIIALRPEVRQGARQVQHLVGFQDKKGTLLAFLGVQGAKIEMLFIHAAARGRGIGKALLAYATGPLGATQVDVNEQNTQAAGFYRHMGFAVAGRSPRDEAGRPFPILHLQKEENT